VTDTTRTDATRIDPIHADPPTITHIRRVPTAAAALTRPARASSPTSNSSFNA